MTAFTSAPKHAVDTPVGGVRFMSAWRRSADEVRGDRLLTASVGLVGAVIGTAVALFGRGTTAAVYVGLVTLCVTPGCALVCWLSTGERLTRAVAVLATSLTWTILVTSILAWLQVTSLGVLLLATAGVGGIGSAVFFVVHLPGYLKRTQTAAPVDDGENPSRRSLASAFSLTGTLVAAAGLLAIAVIHAHGRAAGSEPSYGLLPLLGVPFLAAAVLTIGVLVVALRSVRITRLIAVAALGLLLVEFTGTQMMLATTPLAGYVYKHFGVVDYLVHGGALNDPLDIYQQWPGFFAGAAGLVRLSGLSPLAYANWAELFFEALNSIVLFAIARRLSRHHQLVPYITVLLFLTINWEGQEYFSPQTMAFELSLLFQFFLLSLLEPARLRRPSQRWLSIPELSIQGGERIGSLGLTARVIGLIAIFCAIVVTHQLSPYMVFAGVAGLWVLGVLRHPLIMLALAIMLVGYPFLHLAAVDQNPVLSGFSASNATGVQGFRQASPPQVLGSDLAKVICVIFWGATAVCGLSYRRRIGVIAIPIVFAVMPLSFILVSNYGGEAIFRVFLFSSPWCALIIAIRLADLARAPMLRLTAVASWALFAALGSAQAADFGQYPVLQMPQGEITASAYFLDHAPSKAVLVMAASNFPGRLNGRYVLHDTTQSSNDPGLDAYSQFAGNRLQRMSPKSLAQSVTNLAGGLGYLVIAPSMYPYERYYEFFTPGTLSALIPRLKASPYWQVWYQDAGTVIFQAWPQGIPAEKASIRHSRGVR